MPTSFRKRLIWAGVSNAGGISSLYEDIATVLGDLISHGIQTFGGRTPPGLIDVHDTDKQNRQHHER
jgi:hypothetical protein